MKIFILAMMTMLLTATSVSAQTNTVDMTYPMTFDQMCETLNLSVRQKRQAEKAVAQYLVSMDYFNSLSPSERNKEAVERINNRHLTAMQPVLTRKQFAAYKDMIGHASERRVALYEREIK